MDKKVIFIVDDEPDICELVSLHLKKNGFNSKSFFTASHFLKTIENEIPDLIILDLMLPDMDGLEICKLIRGNKNTSHIPIIMLTAKGEETDKILGLELGADDYVTKPFSPRELVARVKAVLRRRENGRTEEIINIGDMSIYPERFDVFIKGKRIDLTATEFRILLILTKRKGWVFTREQILEELWAGKKFVLDRTVDVHIRNLREKLGPYGKLIKSVRGIGYKIDDK